jgi:hypothetical protein
MITPKESQVWQDSSGYKYTTFISGYNVGSHDKYGNVFNIESVVHGVNGWERVFPEVNDE